MTKDDSFDKRYKELTILIDQEFDRNINLHGDKIKCRKGCSQCCYQIFRITAADAFNIKENFSALTTDVQKTLKQKADVYIKRKNSFNAEYNNDHNESFKQACPALDESGACMVYDSRPIICRRFGPPVYDYKGPGNVYACELNFSPGEEIKDDKLITEQTNIGKKWDMIKTGFNIQNDLKENASTTIAEALLNS